LFLAMSSKSYIVETRNPDRLFIGTPPAQFSDMSSSRNSKSPSRVGSPQSLHPRGVSPGKFLAVKDYFTNETPAVTSSVAGRPVPPKFFGVAGTGITTVPALADEAFTYPMRAPKSRAAVALLNRLLDDTLARLRLAASSEGQVHHNLF
jgi:hypothetical protein